MIQLILSDSFDPNFVLFDIWYPQVESRSLTEYFLTSKLSFWFHDIFATQSGIGPNDRSLICPTQEHNSLCLHSHIKSISLTSHNAPGKWPDYKFMIFKNLFQNPQLQAPL